MLRTVLPNTHPLQLSRFLFTICLVFFIVGLGNGFLGDLEDGRLSVIINDGFSLSIFLAILTIVWLNKMRPSTGLMICTTEALRNFYMALLFIGLDNPHYVYAHDEIMKLLLITCLFASVLGLAVNKNIALIYNIGGIAMQFVYTAVFRDDNYFQEQFIVNCIIMTGNLCVVYYYRNMLEKTVDELSDSYQTTSKYQIQVEQLNEQNRPFVVFGRNTAGLVHDFRNDVNGIDLTIQTMNLRYQRGKTPTAEDFDLIERSLGNLRDRIEKVQYLTSATNDRPKEMVNLAMVVDSALYPFTISTELRRHFRFDPICEGDVITYGYRLQYLQIIENIVRNSCEAIVSLHDEEPTSEAQSMGTSQDIWGRVGVHISGGQENIKMIFTDDGPGISFCKNAKSHIDCMNCDCFAIGRSTKSYGSGYGMVNIINSVRELGGTLKINTSDSGTMITIDIPRHTG